MRSIVLTAFCLLFVSAHSIAHELPTGEVRRDAQVVVFPDRIEVQYAVVTGTATMRPMVKGMVPAEEPVASLDEWKAYQKVLVEKIPENVQLLVADKLIRLKLSSAEIEQRHHTTLRFVFAAEYEVGEAPQKLLLVDRNFEENDGVHRVAAKGRRGVEVGNSSQPATVSRVDRKPWEQKSAAEKSATIRVTCDVRLAE